MTEEEFKIFFAGFKVGMYYAAKVAQNTPEPIAEIEAAAMSLFSSATQLQSLQEFIRRGLKAHAAENAES